MDLTPQQEQAAQSPTSVAITAGAGTGKTHMLAGRYLFHLQQGLSPLEIVAMTFTDKASSELRSRIRQTVKEQAPEQWDWLAELEAAPICTFHSLAARICHEHPEAAGVPADFTPLDEWEGQLWQSEQVAIALDQLPKHLYAQIPYSSMKEAIEAFLQDPLSAEEALQRTQGDWLPGLQKTQTQIIQTLLNHPFWQEAQAIISQNQGQPGDKLEVVRQGALTLIETIEAHQNNVQSEEFQMAFSAWKTLKVGTVGSQKHWTDQETLKMVRGTLISWRDFTKNFPDISLVTMQWGALDEQIAAMLPVLGEAFTFVRQFLTEAKRKQRLLDFNDLEVHALKALKRPEISEYYHQRWQAFLIDEFQDTNATQGRLLDVLTQGKTLTLVGDEKQSIYGFRRADIQVFQQWRDRLDNTIPLSTSFRTHDPLIKNINQIFALILEDLHQALDGDRSQHPHPAPHVESFIIVRDPQSATKPNVDQLRQGEAEHIAELVQQMLVEKRLIWDKKRKQHRPVQPGDIAILGRAWEPLELYAQAIGERQVDEQQIPVLQAGGGNLLDTREAKDGLALLQFLADARDDIALVAVLRSPFFGLSDRVLLQLGQTAPDNQTWWELLQASDNEKLIKVVEVLKQLRDRRPIDPPSRLLQRADRLTGYTAVIANLPNHQRRLTDWYGFLDIVHKLEAGTAEVFIVTRRLKKLVASDIEVKRPPLEAGNAVTLMTIHGAKGLEWPVVIVPDLARKPPIDNTSVRFNPSLGVAVKLEDEAGEKQKSALYLLLEHRQKEQDKAEMKRLLYVAATRAGDHLIFTTVEGDGGVNLWQLLQASLQGESSPQEIPFNPDEHLGNLTPPDSPLSPLPAEVLLTPVFGGLQLPVTSLTDYARCPKRFYYQHMAGHPGELTGTGSSGREIGILTHRILAQGITEISQIATSGQTLPMNRVQEALELAEVFRRNPIYTSVQSGQWEQPLSLKMGKIRFNGVADLVGNDFILDIKTEREMNPQEHRFQVWAYAKAMKKPNAYIADLRHNQLLHFSKEDLCDISQEADQLIMSIESKLYAPTSSEKTCQYCPYQDICDQAFSSCTI
jgi:ATP-dependent helicase/nuclease subunit A